MKETELVVQRGGPDEPVRDDRFTVPYEDGMSVLDAVLWIRRHRDSSLAVRYSCINANACKECLARIDGAVGYLCTTRLRATAMTVAPLATRPLIRDLVTDIVPPQELPPDRTPGGRTDETTPASPPDPAASS
jgi:succinate dehydrogenase/fumarate reductase-like Fe-S protein